MSRHLNSRQMFWYRLKVMGYQSYSEYLSSAHWLDFRSRFYRSKVYKGCCWACGKTGKTQLHHLTYKRLGHERISDVVALCDYCHSLSHEGQIWKVARKIKRRNLRRFGVKGDFKAPQRFRPAPRRASNFIEQAGWMIYSPV